MFLDRNKGKLPTWMQAEAAKGISSLALLLQPGNIIQIHHKKGGYAVSSKRPASLQREETDVFAPSYENTQKNCLKAQEQVL